MKAEPSENKLSYCDTEIVKGMLKRDDHLHDIAGSSGFTLRRGRHPGFNYSIDNNALSPTDVPRTGQPITIGCSGRRSATVDLEHSTSVTRGTPRTCDCIVVDPETTPHTFKGGHHACNC